MSVWVTGDIHGNPIRLSTENFYEQKDMVNKEFKKYIEAARVVAIWRTMKGRSIPKE